MSDKEKFICRECDMNCELKATIHFEDDWPKTCPFGVLLVISVSSVAILVCCSLVDMSTYQNGYGGNGNDHPRPPAATGIHYHSG